MEINTFLLVAALLTGTALSATLVLAFNGKALKQLNKVKSAFSGIAAAFATYKRNRRDEHIALLIGAVDSDVTTANLSLKQAIATIEKNTKELAKLTDLNQIFYVQELLQKLEAEFATYSEAKAELFGLLQPEFQKFDPIYKQKVKNKSNNAGNNNNSGGGNNSQGDKGKTAKEQARAVAEKAGLSGQDKGTFFQEVNKDPDGFLAKSEDDKLAFAKTFNKA